MPLALAYSRLCLVRAGRVCCFLGIIVLLARVIRWRLGSAEIDGPTVPRDIDPANIEGRRSAITAVIGDDGSVVVASKHFPLFSIRGKC